MLPKIRRATASTASSMANDTSHEAVLAATSTSRGKYTFLTRPELAISEPPPPDSPLERNV
jgi:hypothetical protein